MWATSLLMVALAVTAKVVLPESAEDPPEDPDIEINPDTRSYTIHLGDQEGPDPEEYIPSPTAEEFTRQELWRISLRQYVAVGEICSPPGSVRQIYEATGYNQHHQKRLKSVLEEAAGGQPIWEVPKSQRRAWIASSTFPDGLPPLPRKNPPAPLSDTPLESAEGV